jgi:hypothetical protein
MTLPLTIPSGLLIMWLISARLAAGTFSNFMMCRACFSNVMVKGRSGAPFYCVPMTNSFASLLITAIAYIYGHDLHDMEVKQVIIQSLIGTTTVAESRSLLFPPVVVGQHFYLSCK